MLKSICDRIVRMITGGHHSAIDTSRSESSLSKGASQASFDANLLQKRLRSLPPDAIVLYHSVARPPNAPTSNFKRLFMKDGNVFRANHADKGNDPWLSDDDFPQEPEGKLESGALERLCWVLRSERFFEQPTEQHGGGIDGQSEIVLARLEGQEREVLYHNCGGSLTVFLNQPFLQRWNEPVADIAAPLEISDDDVAVGVDAQVDQYFASHPDLERDLRLSKEALLLYHQLVRAPAPAQASFKRLFLADGRVFRAPFEAGKKPASWRYGPLPEGQVSPSVLKYIETLLRDPAFTDKPSVRDSGTVGGAVEVLLFRDNNSLQERVLVSIHSPLTQALNAPYADWLRLKAEETT